ncbi:MAG: hypothetical protein IPM29_07840 [Planctomycetes bacterium]|nr:hypothetical protein [Planctomycetota bacterium]
MTTKLLTMLVLALPVAAQQGPNGCPDHGLKTEKTRAEFTFSTDCDGASIYIGNTGISVPRQHCPTLVTVTPTRDVPVHEAGSGMIAVKDGTVDVVTYRFRCKRDWVLFIPIGSSCVPDGQQIVARPSTYTLMPCDAAAHRAGAGAPAAEAE